MRFPFINAADGPVTTSTAGADGPVANSANSLAGGLTLLGRTLQSRSCPALRLSFDGGLSALYMCGGIS